MKSIKEKSIIVGIKLPRDKRWRVEEHLDELALLADTAGAEIVHRVIQERERYDAAYLIGKGKAEELRDLCLAEDIDTVISDDELTPAQVRNLEKITDVKVLDRTELILDIFAQRARTMEGKLQVELAQLQYRLPRLVGKGIALSRLGGGIGTRGPGETKLEVDRRRIRERIRKINEELKKVKRTRGLHRKGRKSIPIPTVAIVGYTNTGKSTLLNAVTNAGVLVEDKLFATLDPTIRRVLLPTKEEFLLSDTVGFIRKLPHQLVAAFKATLEEVIEADLLLHVIDASHPQMAEQIESVESVLEEIGAADKPRIEVYNKIDKLADDRFVKSIVKQREDSIAISALKGEGIDKLLISVRNRLFPRGIRRTFLIPYNQGELLNKIYQKGKVLSKEYLNDGVLIGIEANPRFVESLKGFLAEEEAVRKLAGRS